MHGIAAQPHRGSSRKLVTEFMARSCIQRPCPTVSSPRTEETRPLARCLDVVSDAVAG
jgi:hypothetical protein